MTSSSFRVSEFIKLSMLSALLNPVIYVCVSVRSTLLFYFFWDKGASDRGMNRSKEAHQRKILLPASTVGNAVKGYKKCEIETHNPLVFREYDFSASNATDHDVVDDETENNSANPQTLVVEIQHINPQKNQNQHNVREKTHKRDLKHSYKHTHQTNVRTKEKTEGRTENFKKKQRREAREAEKGSKKTQTCSCRAKSVNSRPNSPVASTSKDGVIRCPACEENIVTLQQKNGSSAVNAKSGDMRNVLIVKMAFLFVTILICTTKHFNNALQYIMLS
ncbi:hypothetical protein TNCV_1726351 [Trichonephila clavipes]|nr:hypothetical protein TNCV_1726351 [Trichonephila clavipes]